MSLGYPVVPENLGRIAVLVAGYGATCTVFGIVFGYVIGPSIAHRYRRLAGRLRHRR